MTETQKIASILSIKNLTKRFGSLVATNNVDFDVKEGEILGIIGPNGSGKTTLFNLISGVLQPDEGEILARPLEKSGIINGIMSLPSSIISRFRGGDQSNEYKNIIGKSTNKIVTDFGIARTFQIVRPFKFMTAEQNMTVPHVPKNVFSRPSTIKRKAISSLLDVDLGEKKNYPALILPHGDLKRLDFSRTMSTEPNVLLLDEPFSGLSVEDSFRVTQLIKKANKERGTTIMIVEHKLKLLANLVNRIIVLDQGMIIADGTPEEISKNKLVISSYLGEEASFIVGN